MIEYQGRMINNNLFLSMRQVEVFYYFVKLEISIKLCVNKFVKKSELGLLD